MNINYVVLGVDLFKRSVDETLLFLEETKVYVTLEEDHEWTCGSHQDGEKIKWTLFQLGIYWPTIFKDFINYANAYEECKKYGPIQQVPTSELHSILKPWPFRGWAMDLIGQIHPSSLKGHKYILVAFDYFTKWVEVVPLKNVEQSNIIWLYWRTHYT